MTHFRSRLPQLDADVFLTDGGIETTLSFDDGFDFRVNRDAVELLVATRAAHATATSPIVISGCIGPRGDGYQVGAVMSRADAQAYLAARYRDLRALVPNLRVLGGCCGTGHHHVGAISQACARHSA